jgi:Leucine-rich repeat (LRR) protein
MALTSTHNKRSFQQLSQKDIDDIIYNNGTWLQFNYLSEEKRKELRDSDVIDIIDSRVDADAITHIALYNCVGITDATLVHIATKCTNLDTLGVNGCVKITDDGIQAIVEKIGNNLTHLGYNNCNRCTDAALQSIVNHCPNLAYLDFDNAGVSKVPHNIGKRLPKMEYLCLTNNNIKSLPPSIALFEKDAYIKFDGNPLEDPPFDIVKEGVEAVEAYFLHQYIDASLKSGAEEPAENSNARPAEVARVRLSPSLFLCLCQNSNHRPKNKKGNLYWGLILATLMASMCAWRWQKFNSL